MRKLLIISAFLPLAAAAQDGGKDFKLTGKLRKLPDSLQVNYVYMRYRTGGSSQTDSVKPVNGSYTFKGKIDEPVIAYLSVKYVQTDSSRKAPAMRSSRDLATVYLEEGSQKIVSTDSFANARVRGSKANTEYKELVKAQKPYAEKFKPLYEQYSAFAKAKDKAGQDRVEAVIDSLDAEMKELVFGAYVKNNSSSPVAMYALQQYAGYDINAEKVEPVYNSLSEKIRANPSGVAFKESLDIAKLTGIGRQAPDFTQNDTLDQPVSLSSFRGKYVLVDFWASWCGPCRAENPNVVKAFNKYKDRNFHIVGVSLDRPGQKEKWLKAIHDDGLVWTQVSDLKFWDNAVAKQYGIRAIPQNLLIDPAGKIIGKNLRGEDLDAKLSAEIESKKAF